MTPEELQAAVDAHARLNGADFIDITSVEIFECKHQVPYISLPLIFLTPLVSQAYNSET